MISFLENGYMDDYSVANINPVDYSGYSLMEATYVGTMVIDEMMNEAQMEAAIEEYRYLAENGTEIVYEDFDEMKDKAKDTYNKAKDRVIAAVRAFAAHVSGLFKKATTYVQVHLTSITAKLGLSKKSFDDAIKKINSGKSEESVKDDMEEKLLRMCNTQPYIMSPVILIKGQGKDDYIYTGWANGTKDYKFMDKSVTDLINKNLLNNGDGGKYQKMPAWYSYQAISDIVFSGFKKIGRTILETKAKVDKSVSQALKDAKDAKPDSYADLMKNYQEVMKWNSKVLSAKLKIYQDYSKTCQQMAKAICSYSRKDVEEGPKEERSKNKVSAALRNA